MIKKYILAGLLILFPVSAFADGGLPLWINTIQTVAATSGIKGLGYPLSSSVITLICLILIIFCETLFLKKRYFKTTNTVKIIEAVSFANLISTVLGGLLLWAVFYVTVFMADSNSLGYLFLGPLYGILTYLPRNSAVEICGFVFILVFYNVFFCFFSYFIERFIIKKYLQKKKFEQKPINPFLYSSEIVSKGVLRANILSYSISFFLMLPIYFFLHGIL